MNLRQHRIIMWLHLQANHPRHFISVELRLYAANAVRPSASRAQRAELNAFMLHKSTSFPMCAVHASSRTAGLVRTYEACCTLRVQRRKGDGGGDGTAVEDKLRCRF